MCRKTWPWLLVGLVAVCAGVTCAPTEPPRPPEKGKDKDQPRVELKKDGPGGPAAVVPVCFKPKGPPPDALAGRIEEAIDQVRRREVETAHGFWTVFHAILGLGPSVTVKDSASGKHYNALELVCNGGNIRAMDFEPTPWGVNVDGDIRNRKETFFSQGHQDQFIAEMAEWGMPLTRKFRVKNKDCTFEDFVRHSEMRASVKKPPQEKQELSWTIIVVGQFRGTDYEWTNADGDKLKYEDIVRYEVNEDVENAACGGTHRLYGLTWAYYLHRAKGGKDVGVWKDVVERTKKYQQNAKQNRNGDGSFSTEYFRGPGNAKDPELRIASSGHILEWLALSLPEAELKKAWMQDAANAVAMMIIESRHKPVAGGSLYHAVHGLLTYYARVYGPERLGPNAPYHPPFPKDPG
ncbi:MAG TPA: hypothetical protein VFA26_02410 [Gemmataceae bacterium]|nr:hypothetical protein [Gemmataceae bacterium]